MLNARSLWFEGPRRVGFRETPVASPGRGEIQVRALYSAISQGTELLVYRGQVAPDLPLDLGLTTMEGSFRFPIKYGYASVGEVHEVGAGVTALRPGDRVFVHYPHQSAYVVDASRAIKLPADLPPTHGVFLASLETAFNIVLDSRLHLGETVAIFGQGVVGLLLTQLLRKAGAELVIAIDRFERRRTLAQQLGAHLVFPPADDIAQRIRASTDGRGADIVIEASGAPEALAPAIRAVADQATVVVVSWYGTKPVTLPLGEEFHRGRLTLKSSQVSRLDPSLAPRWTLERRLQTVLRWLPVLPLDQLISHCYPLAEASRAYEQADLHPEEMVQMLFDYESSRG